MQAVLLIGIQATGKSSFYKERFFRSHVRINLDMLKTRHREKLLLEACLTIKQKFVIDNTNPTVDDRAKYLKPAMNAGFEIVGYYFQSRVNDCLPRNAQRPEEERVPEAAIYGTAGKLQIPTYEEGFDVLHYVWITKDGFRVAEWREDGAVESRNES
ncbi:MAG: AAA family ATPase [Gemmataceae bacterium]